MLSKDLGTINLNNREIFKNRENNLYSNENKGKIMCNNIKKNSNNPNLAKRLSKLTIDY